MKDLSKYKYFLSYTAKGNAFQWDMSNTILHLDFRIESPETIKEAELSILEKLPHHYNRVSILGFQEIHK